jgi:hypothetical protein
LRLFEFPKCIRGTAGGSRKEQEDSERKREKEREKEGEALNIHTTETNNA